ncbi:MAG: Hpt domain-containing protein [Pirellulales bacterium]|nr:Hpt domain-containing protein [Pirellulales bacterium]
MTDEVGIQDDFLESMLGDFIDESEGLLQQLNENLLVLDDWAGALSPGDEVACDTDLINELFRAAHSLKGLSAMLRLDNINVLTHMMENVFDAARNGLLFIQSETVDLIFRAVDRLSAMIDRLKDPSLAEVKTECILQEIRQLLEANGAQKEASSQADAELAMKQELKDVVGSAEETVETVANCVEELQADAEHPTRQMPDVESTDAAAPSPTTHFQGIQDESDVPANYLAIFIDECDQSLDDLSDLLLTHQSDKSVENLMITCHRIKGSAASIGLARPAKLSHLMEDVLQELLQSDGRLTDEINDALLTCTDALRKYVETLKQGDPQSAGFENAYQALAKARIQHDEDPSAGPNELVKETPENELPASASPASQALTDEEIARVAEDAPEGAHGFVARMTFEANLPLVELKAGLLIERVNSIGQIFYCSPAETEFEAQDNFTSLTLGIATSISRKNLASKLDLAGVASVTMTSLPSQTSPADKQASTPAPTVSADVSKKLTSEENPQQAAPNPPQPSEKQPTETSRGDANTKSQRRGVSKPAETLRVDIERLDQLMNLAGQLVINKARFVQISDGLRHLTQVKNLAQSVEGALGLVDRMGSDLNSMTREAQASPLVDNISNLSRQLRDDLESVQKEVGKLSEVRGLVGDLSEAVHQLDRAADGIQKSVMDTRMVPIGPLFGRFKRVVRDLTRETEKEVTLQITGEKTELDKRMIDELGDPLIHMVRNSVDHGVELPEDRVAAGKPRSGVVKLDAFHRGNQIVIQITDDGKGLDPAKLRNKAIARGLVTEADAERMTPQQVFQLIWEPGFSTAEKVTEVSGRGMGMDIVRSKIEELNGTVELDSTPGEGTVFTIRLPLTMAILPTLLCRINGDVFAIPVESVLEIVRVRNSELSTVRNQRTATVRGRVVSVVALADMFTWNRPPQETNAESEANEITLVIIGVDDKEIGLLVHGLIGEEDIVIKSMSENYRNVDGIAGASILGDGRVSLILDVSSILDMSCRMRGGPSQGDEVAKVASNEECAGADDSALKLNATLSI